MFRCCIGIGSMTIADLETRINTWVTNNDTWSGDSIPNEISEVNTELDGTGVTYHTVTVRFEETDTKANLLQKFTDKLKNKVDWYRVGYHVCDHDASDPTGCSWDDSVDWTDKNVTIPAGIPTFS